MYFGVSFHSTLEKEYMLNYIIRDFKKKNYLVDDEPLNIMEKCDVHIKMPNQSI